MNFSGNKKFLLIGIIVVLLAAIPLTVYFLQQNQETRSHAQKATKLYFANSGQTAPASASIQKNVGDDIPVDVIVDPGSNQVSFIKMTLSYDSSKLSIDQTNGVKQSEASFPSVLEGPTYADGSVTVTLSIGADPTKVAQSPTKVATITFKAKDTTGSTPTTVKFLDGQTQVLSIASSDQPSENVLASTSPINIAIGAGAGVSTTPGPTTANQAPTCTSLSVDRAGSGPAPLSVTLTANGRDADGTISKVTFNFGDGPVQDVTQGGTIGTNTVSTPLAHTYNNVGSYQASVVLTDNSGAISSGGCTQTITVTAKGGGGGGAGGNPPVQPTTAPVQPTTAPVQPTTPPVEPTTPPEQPTPRPTLPKAGPGDTVLAGGVVAAVVSIVGALMFFSL